MSSSQLDYAIFGMGNPLLNISAVVPQATLDTWDVKLNDAILAEEKHIPLYADLIKNFKVEYMAGGATQNSIRVAQWALQHPNATTFTGCVGSDTFGAQLAKSATADGVRVLYQADDSISTGTCACLVKDKERSLIANLAAANKFTVDHLSTEPLKQAIAQAKIFYSSGYLLTVSPPAFQHVAAHAAEHNKLVAVNLAAPFIISFFSEPLLAAIQVSDFVFGNESEAEAFAAQQQLEKKDAKSVALHIAAMPQCPGGATRPRVAVITQGGNSTWVATEGKATEYAVPVLDAKLLVDTDGAGDAFVGGFLAQLARGKDLAKCIQAGHYCARMVIQLAGAAIPTHKPDATQVVV